MKAKASCRERLKLPRLNAIKHCVLFTLMVVPFLPEAVHAENAAIRFHGSVTQASCDARPAVQGQNAIRAISSSTGGAVDVSTLNTACSPIGTAVTARYQALPTSEHTVDTQHGVLILTYE